MSVIAIAAAHRALVTLEVLVYTFDALSVTTELLHKNAAFQPWEALQHWRGVRVPITLGTDASGFTWDATSPSARFLRWDDFLERCALLDATNATPKSRVHEMSRASPFDELDAIAARLRASTKSAADLAQVDEILARIAEVAEKHAGAVSCEWHSLGFDNTGNARMYAKEADGHLAEARALLQNARDVVAR